MAIDRKNIDADWLTEAYSRVGNTNVNAKEQEQDQQYLALRLWDTAVCNIPQILAMTEWNAESITDLTINHCRLVVFHVAVFPNLTSLDLSNNCLSSIRGCGLEFCKQLQTVNLCNNVLSNAAELALFLYVCCRHL
jgi:Leucine-rich repeat (LRR) protein